MAPGRVWAKSVDQCIPVLLEIKFDFSVKHSMFDIEQESLDLITTAVAT